MTITITNPAADAVAENGVAVSDTLPTGLTPSAAILTNTCGGTASVSGQVVSLTGGSIPVNGNCAVIVTVTGTTSGSYTDTTGDVSSTDGGTGLTATANLTVTGAAPTYPATFTESGLPSGTEWWVNITGEPSQRSTATTTSISLPNGSYSYTVATSDKLYSATGGSFTVAGTTVSESVTFTLVTYAVTLTESGLPSGTEWWVNVTGSLYHSSPNSSAISFMDPNGTYHFTIYSANRSYAAPNGSFVVSGAATSQPVTFHLVTYTVTFTESGLPSGTEWWVNGTALGAHGSTTTTITVSEPNGSYPYEVATLDKVYAAPGGSVVVNGGPASQTETFTLVTYAVIFTEVGLPPGTNWSVVLAGVTHSSAGIPIVVHEPNGSYAFTVVAAPGYSVKPPGGSLVVNGTNVGQAFAFTSNSKAAAFLGLPATEGYALVGGIIAVVLAGVVVSLILFRRRAKAPSNPAKAPSSTGSPPKQL
jgi:hypothetical protein